MKEEVRTSFLKKRSKKLLSVGAVLALQACASADPAYYTLQAQPGIPTTTRAVTIEIRRPGLAGYLDRSDVVLAAADYKLDVNTQIRWAEPLGDMIGRILAQDLTQRLPSAAIFTQSGAISAAPGIRLEVDILNFNSGSGNQVTLTAQIALERGTTHSPLTTQAVSLSAAPSGPGPAALAAALSTLMGQLSDTIAVQIRSALPTG